MIPELRGCCGILIKGRDFQERFRAVAQGTLISSFVVQICQKQMEYFILVGLCTGITDQKYGRFLCALQKQGGRDLSGQTGIQKLLDICRKSFLFAGCFDPQNKNMAARFHAEQMIKAG